MVTVQVSRKHPRPDGVRLCAVLGCEKLHKAPKGLCYMHYDRLQTHGSLDTPPKKGKSICSIEECDNTVRALQLCSVHYDRRRAHGDTALRPKQIQPLGPDSPMWKGGKSTSKTSGYVSIYVFEDEWLRSSASSKGYMLEHRYIMAKFLGRTLLSSENVHHINGVRDDNRLENLELWSKSQPAGQRVSDKIVWARKLLTMYGIDETIYRGGNTK